MRFLLALTTPDVRSRGPLVVAALLLGALCLPPAVPAQAVPTKLSLEVEFGAVAEGKDPATLYVFLHTYGAPVGGTTVTLTVHNELTLDREGAKINLACATEGDDFSLSAKTVVIPEGERRGTPTITVVDDKIFDPGESVCLSASSTNPTLVLAPLAPVSDVNAKWFKIGENDKPSGPVNLEVTPGDGKLDLSWETSIHEADGYQVYYKKETTPSSAVVTNDLDTGWGDHALLGSVTSLTLTGLTNGVTYDVWVRGRYASYTWGAWVKSSGTPAATASDPLQRQISTNAALQGLTASSSTSATGTFSSLSLEPAFAASTTSYTATVLNPVTHVKLTPTVAHAAAAATVNGTSVSSGTASGAIALSVGTNTVTVRVTAEDGTTTKDYTVTITRQAPTIMPLASDAELSALTASSSTSATGTFSSLSLEPAFAASTTSYTATVLNPVTHVKLTPTVAHAAAAATVNGTSVSSGTASGAIALSVGTNTVTVRVTAEDGATTKDYTVTITRQAPTIMPLASDAELSALTASSSTSATGTFSSLSLEPAFAASTTSYTATVLNPVTHVKLTPTVADAAAAATVNGTSVSSGTASGAIALSVGTNTVTVRVTAEDGATTKDYTVIITRQASTIMPLASDAELSALTASSSTSATGTFSSLSLEPAFAAPTTSYTATVLNPVTHVKLTPTVADAAAAATVNGTSVSSGTASGAIALSVGTNTVTVRVTAEDGATTKDYTVTITRQASTIMPLASDAELSALTASSSTSATGTFSSLSLEPAFAAPTTSYTATVLNPVTHVKLTPTVADAAAAATVNGTSVSSGTASGAIALSVGTNTVTVRVTAEDGTTTKDYTVTITRQAPTIMPLASDAELSALTASSSTSATGTFSSLSLEPAFAAPTTSYTATVLNPVTHVKLTPTVADAAAAATVNGTSVSSGTASGAIALSVGTNTVTVRVTAEDGATTKDYTVIITRQASTIMPLASDAELSALTASSSTSATGTFSSLSLEPAFAAPTTSYTATVLNPVTHVKLTPTVADAAAAATVNGTSVSSGTASGAIALSVGTNTVTVRVTAEDGATTKDYTVTITRLPTHTTPGDPPSSAVSFEGSTYAYHRSGRVIWSYAEEGQSLSIQTAGFTQEWITTVEEVSDNVLKLTDQEGRSYYLLRIGSPEYQRMEEYRKCVNANRGRAEPADCGELPEGIE